MKITIYFNPDTLKYKAEMLAKDEDELEEYLDYTYTPSEVFRLTDEERKDVMSDFKEDWCWKRAKQILLEDEDYIEREVEV